MPKLLTAITMINVTSMWLSSPALAVSTTFSQKILPLNCIFTTINAGTGELYYVTPEECGIVVNSPPQPQSGHISSNAPGQPYNNWLPYFERSTAHSSNSDQNFNFPWKPIVTVNKNVNSQQSNPPKLGKVKTVAGVISIIGVVAILVFIF